MKPIVLTSFLVFVGAFLLPAQNPTQEIRVKNLRVEFKAAPRYVLQANAPPSDPTAKWLLVEAELESMPDWADEVTVKFYVVANYGVTIKRESPNSYDVLAASVTVVNMPKNVGTGKKNIVPVFMDSNTVKRYGAGGTAVHQFIPQVAVQVYYKGILQDKHWMTEAQKGVSFWEAKPPRNGILMNLLQSPWFPAYAEFYEQVKSTSSPSP